MCDAVHGCEHAAETSLPYFATKGNGAGRAPMCLPVPACLLALPACFLTEMSHATCQCNIAAVASEIQIAAAMFPAFWVSLMVVAMLQH